MHESFLKINQTDLKYLKKGYDERKIILKKQSNLRHFEEINNRLNFKLNNSFLSIYSTWLKCRLH